MTEGQQGRGVAGDPQLLHLLSSALHFQYEALIKRETFWILDTSKY